MLVMTDNDLLKLNCFAESAPELMSAYAYDAYAHMTNLHADANGSDTVRHGFSIDNAAHGYYSCTADTTTWHAYDYDVHYYGYRYYSPSLGRWLSRDPVGEEGSTASMFLHATIQRNKKKVLEDNILRTHLEDLEHLLKIISNKPELQAQVRKALLKQLDETSPALIKVYRQDERKPWGTSDRNEINLYIFVSNNPIDSFDLFGLADCSKYISCGCHDYGLYAICSALSGIGPKFDCMGQCLLGRYNTGTCSYSGGGFGVPDHIDCYKQCF